MNIVARKTQLRTSVTSYDRDESVYQQRLIRVFGDSHLDCVGVRDAKRE